MAAEACIANFKKQLSLAPNIYACTAGHVLPSILYNHYYSPHSLMGSIYLSQFKLTRIQNIQAMAAGSIRCVTFSNSQHWKPNTSITELQGFLGTIVAYSAGDACGTFLSGIAKLNYTSCVVS